MFKSGQILKHRQHGALIRVLKPHPKYGHEILTSYFYSSMSDSLTFEHYQPATYMEWVKTTVPQLKERYLRRKTKGQPTFLWLLNTIRLAYLPTWRMS